MPYNSYRFSCEHVLLKRLSFLSKLSIILNCHSKKRVFSQHGGGSSQPNCCWLGTHLHTQRHADANKHTPAHTCMCTMPTPSCPSASTLPKPLVPPQHSLWLWQWVREAGPYHSQGTELGTLGRAKEVSAKSELSWGQREGKASFPHPRQVDVCGKCSVF